MARAEAFTEVPSRDAARWVISTAAITAVVSFAFAGGLALSRSAFVAVHASVVVALVATYVSSEEIDVVRELRRGSFVRVALATLVAGVLLVASVFPQSGAPRAHGLELAAQIAGWGLVYGMADGLALTVLPMHAVLGALRGIGGGALALAASLLVYVAYHLGFPEYRGAQLLGPLAACVVTGAAYLATKNPLAPLLAHAAMHVAAVLHGPAGTMQLPPHS